MKKLFVLLLVGLSIHAKAQNEKKAVAINRFRVALQGGFSQLLAKTSDAVPAESKNYVAELKSGSHFGADVTYFVKPTWGLGAKFSQFSTSNSGIDNSEGLAVPMSDDIAHSFVGPSFSTNYTTANTKHTFIFSLALGYLGYNNNAKYNGQPVKITGGTFGSALDAGYDLNITKSFAIGAQISMTGGTLSKLAYSSGGVTNTETFDKDEKESLSRIDFSLGARFNF